MSFSDWLQRAWYQDSWLLRAFRPLSYLYTRVAQQRRAGYLTGQKVAWKATVPLIVVGNITVGGTGKTPMILWLIEHCQQRGLRVGVVSRGYGAKPPSFPWQVTAEQSAAEAGDEPLLIVQRTGVPLYIAPDRPAAVQALLAEHAVDLILSDDGLQHYALGRDLELLVIDAVRGLGNRHCLPEGPLREPAERVSSVDAVLLNGAVSDSSDGFCFHLQPDALVRIADGAVLPLTQLPAGQRVHAVAGIGHPQRFFSTLERLQWQPIPHAFADHAQYSAELLQFEPKLPLLMTEKDAVKCRAFAASDWYYLRVSAQPSAHFSAWLDEQLERLLPQ